MSIKKVFIINAGKKFLQAEGILNQLITENSINFFSNINCDVRVTNLNKTYDPEIEVENYKWADLVIYQTPIWWFNIPFVLKQYFDVILSLGRTHNLAKGDGRSRKNPNINYGTGGLLKGKPYIVTTTMNAPKSAFTNKNEFFDKTSIDNGILYGFHKTHQYLDMSHLASFHFYDVIKNPKIETEMEEYNHLLKNIVENKPATNTGSRCTSL